MQQPLVSVVTTCYRHAPYLPDYFEGLLAQTYPNIELVFLDDGSPDNSWDVAQRYEPALRERLARVVMIRQDNQGMFAAIERVVNEATGEFVCLLESDDYYLPTKVEENVRLMIDRPDVGLVHSDFEHVFADRITRLERLAAGQIPDGEVLEEVFRGHVFQMCTVCVRRELLQQHVDWKTYRRRGYLMGDYAMCLDLARHTKFAYINSPLARYRVLDESASHSRNPYKRVRFWLSHLQIKADYIARYGLASSPVGDQVRTQLLSAAYWLCKWGYYTSALRVCFIVLHVWGPQMDVSIRAVKVVLSAFYAPWRGMSPNDIPIFRPRGKPVPTGR